MEKKIKRSLNLNSNQELLSAQKSFNHNSTKEFVYDTYDNMLSIKAIKKDEFDFICLSFERYWRYQKESPDNLLAKIYALFTIQLKDLGSTLYVAIMQNIAQVDDEFIVRDYTFNANNKNRGQKSSFRRKVVDQGAKRNGTDFLRQEGNLRISLSDREAL